MKKRRIEAVVKLTERCNIDCTYCYMFNQGSEAYLRHPKQIARQVVSDSAEFLARGAKDLAAEVVRVIFHGGEPMMLKLDYFEWICITYLETIKSAGVTARVELAMQTNGTLVTDEWIEVLTKYDVRVGISLDGAKADNDEMRVDHRGKGSYSRAVAGLKRLQDASVRLGTSPPGLICVINPKRDARVIYRHFVDVLGVTKLSFLMPMESHDSMPDGQPEELGRYLSELFSEWTKDDNPKIKLRIFNEIFTFLMSGDKFLERQECTRREGTIVFAIATNGEIGMGDELKALNLSWPKVRVDQTSLTEYLMGSEAVFLDEMAFSLPNDCFDCAWQNHCLGGSQFGSVINRYGRGRGFDNSSIYCSALRSLYTLASTKLLQSGIPLLTIEKSVDSSLSGYRVPVPVMPVVAVAPTASVLNGKAIHFMKSVGLDAK